jgi:hypothetical protein
MAERHSQPAPRPNMVIGVAAKRRARLPLWTGGDSGITARSRWDRSVAESGADAESFSVAVLRRWAGEVWSFRAPGGSGDTVQAMNLGSRGDDRDVAVQMLKAED